MKILKIINSLEAGGAEKLVVDMAIEFHKNGIEVTLLLLNGIGTPLKKKLKSFPGIQLHSLTTGKNIYNPLLGLKLKSWLSNYDIIHVHLFPSSYWVALANIISFKRHNIIFTEHNTTNRRRSKPVFKIIDRIIYKQFKSIVSISDAVDQSLKQHLGKNFSNIIKIHNGIHLETIEKAIPYPKKELGFIDSHKLILQVSSFTPQKDQITLIKALKHLPKSYIVLLVGDGPLIDKCKTIVKQLNLETRVHFLGIRDDVPRLLKSVDTIILSSHYEGLSLSCIEGMASGKPFIASNTPGLGDIVKDAGLLFEDENDKELAQTITNLFSNPKHYNKTIEQCIKRSKKFNINMMIKSYVELYENNYK